jgi:hypothetical protein
MSTFHKVIRVEKLLTRENGDTDIGNDAVGVGRGSVVEGAFPSSPQ